MKLNIELLTMPLTALLQKIGAPEISWEPQKIILPEAQFEITVDVAKQPEVATELFSNPDGLLAVEGRQCLLYIPYGTQGQLPKFHFMDCRTIREMYSAGRLDRYVVTNKTSGLFRMSISSEWYRGDGQEKEVRLHVCKNCLNTWNYKGYRNLLAWEKDRVVNDFDIEEFFASCKSQFRFLPKRTDQSVFLKDAYMENWGEISRGYRAGRGWKCEMCGVDLSDHQEYIHTHHINGNKHDTRPENLMALCYVCHSEQPHHGHMERNDPARALILERRERMQSYLNNFMNTH